MCVQAKQGKHFDESKVEESSESEEEEEEESEEDDEGEEDEKDDAGTGDNSNNNAKSGKQQESDSDNDQNDNNNSENEQPDEPDDGADDEEVGGTKPAGKKKQKQKQKQRQLQKQQQQQQLAAAAKSSKPQNPPKAKSPDSIKLLKRTATKQMMLKPPLPPVVTLHLKRFMQTYRGFQKIDNYVKFPLEFDPALYCFYDNPQQRQQQQQYRYRLYGVVVHGGGMGGGHYTAYVKKNLKANGDDTESDSDAVKSQW